MILDEALFEDVNIFDKQNKELTAEDSAVSLLLNSVIQGEYSAIEQYKSFLVSLPAGYPDVEKVVTEIIEEENVHVGELQALLDTVDPYSQKRKEGELETEEKSEDIESVVIISDNEEAIDEG